MALPTPLPDDPRKWDGWRKFNTDNFYERLCLSFEENPSDETIEGNCRQLLVWWQKKLPLKNQPSNPLTGMLRAGLDDAPRFLSQARAELLDPESRACLDEILQSQIKESASIEFKKFLSFSLSEGVLRASAEERLMEIAAAQGLSDAEAQHIITLELEKSEVLREEDLLLPPEPASAQLGGTIGLSDSGELDDQFFRLLNLSGLEDGEMTDDQRDAFVNMAENLGIAPGDAEDMIDEWIEEQQNTITPAPPVPTRRVTTQVAPSIRKAAPSIRQTAVAPQTAAATRVVPAAPPMTIEEEKKKFRPFTNSLGMPMALVHSGTFTMGTNAPAAPPNEHPAHEVQLTRFYMSVKPVTHELYEKFDASHTVKRPPLSEANHPVVYVTSKEAMDFCEWLSRKESKRYRLPTEAEWEYAAKGNDNRQFPWGNFSGAGHLTNFADRNTNFGWSDDRIDDGFAATSPAGHYPAGASPFGILDMAGNVWEWCSDYFDAYNPGSEVNPKGPVRAGKRIFRGGSWRSRFSGLRTTMRGFNDPRYSFSDLGFRIVCEVE